jgi:hypothetical protein
MDLHLAFTVQLVSGIEEFAVIALSDELFDFTGRQALAEIDFLDAGALFAKETLRFAAGGSSRFQVEFHGR